MNRGRIGFFGRKSIAHFLGEFHGFDTWVSPRYFLESKDVRNLLKFSWKLVISTNVSRRETEIFRRRREDLGSTNDSHSFEMTFYVRSGVIIPEY
jgi:hypothetical protein